jgi:hypothetical protein
MRARPSIAAALLAVACSSTEPSPPRQWYLTCGDPVCRGHVADPSVRACAGEQVGASCATPDTRCDPQDACNRRLVCTTEDPVAAPGGCPISRAAAKEGIVYLEPAQARDLRDELVAVRLATWRYRTDAAGVRRLGFVIDDGVPAAAVTPDGGHVDLYGYTSLAVAAVQDQQRQIDELKREVAELRAALDARRTATGPPRETMRPR